MFDLLSPFPLQKTIDKALDSVYINN
jgi:hypothetical protein